MTVIPELIINQHIVIKLVNLQLIIYRHFKQKKMKNIENDREKMLQYLLGQSRKIAYPQKSQTSENFLKISKLKFRKFLES